MEEACQGTVIAMRTEVENILLDPGFRRSPTIARLLRFLMEETLAGRAHLLKSYIVAVDALGRPADSDAGDNYARVQMGRLRKMLQAYYAEHGPVDRLCIYLQQGHYSLRIGQLAVAYPNLFRPLSVTGPPFLLNPSAQPALAPMKTSTTWLSLEVRYIIFAGILVLLAAMTLANAYWDRLPASQARLSPVLELMPIDAGPGEDAAKMSRTVAASFHDGLPRFRISRTRILRGEPTVSASDRTAAVYRMHFRIEASNSFGSTLFLHLNDVSSNTLIWSREIKIPTETMAINDALAPLMAEINGGHGVIATHSAIQYRNDRGGGYPCLLRYFEFLKTRDAETERLVTDCLEKPVEEGRLLGTTLAARALFAMESSAGAKDQKAAVSKARVFAERALAADANDAAARFAMGRVAYMMGDCETAKFYAHQTVDANPYAPIIMAALAAFTPLCGDPKSEEFLDQAFLVANASDTDARLLLVIAAVAQGRTDRVTQLAHTSTPRNGRHRLNYYLSESIIAASENRNKDSVKYWRRFSAMVDTEGSSPDEKLRDIIRSPELRRRVIVFLKGKGVLR